MTKLEAMHYAQVHKALKGDANAYKAIIEMIKDDPTMVEPLPLLQFVFTDDPKEYGLNAEKKQEASSSSETKDKK